MTTTKKPADPCPCCGQLMPENNKPYVNLEYSVFVDSVRAVSLSSKKALILNRLLQSAPRVVSKEQLMDELYGLETDEEPDQKIIMVYICQLRKDLASTRVSIKTMWGRGFQAIIHQKNKGEEA